MNQIDMIKIQKVFWIWGPCAKILHFSSTLLPAKAITLLGHFILRKLSSTVQVELEKK